VNRTRGLRTLAAVIGSISVVLAAAAMVLLVATLGGPGPTPDASDPSVIQTIIAVAILAFSFPIVGGLIIRRFPGHPLGWIYLAIGAIEAANLFATGYSTFAYLAAAGGLPLATELSWLAVWAWVPAFGLFSGPAILLYPTGQLPSRRWRPVIALAVVAVVLIAVPSAVLAWPYRGLPLERANALNLEPPANSGMALAFAIQNVGQLLLLAAMAGSVAGLAQRFRRSTGVERQQLKWFTYASALVIALLVLWTLAVLDPVVSALSALLFAAWPVSIVVAILRYRLWDIDRIISRTLSYAVLSGTLLAIYAAAVLALEGLLGTVSANAGPVAVAASTLVAASLFQPLRSRISRLVDRRFNRTRYDADRVAESFASHVRDEVEVERVAAALQSVLERTIQPALSAVWLRSAESR
jgi:hypothetical protein